MHSTNSNTIKIKTNLAERSSILHSKLQRIIWWANKHILINLKRLLANNQVSIRPLHHSTNLRTQFHLWLKLSTIMIRKRQSMSQDKTLKLLIRSAHRVYLHITPLSKENQTKVMAVDVWISRINMHLSSKINLTTIHRSSWSKLSTRSALSLTAARVAKLCLWAAKKIEKW